MTDHRRSFSALASAQEATTVDHIQQPIAFAAPIQPPYPAQHSTARPISYPTSSVAPFDPISAVQLSTITGCVDQYESVIVTIKGKHRKNVSSPAPTARAHGNSRYSKGEQWYERGQLPLGRKPSGSPFPPVAELQRMESTVEHRPRSVQKNKNRAANSKRSGPLVSMTLVTITQSAITTLPTMKPRLLVQAKSP